ncbi:helix-turn-helix transcriptional regulator [Epilithonimonas sp. UC225_85]|uniref:helix-turn-helix transcriptional regulator n=1 Tax=Epilithonimonas sp. UC225_85 TaxID=3350167 RepID=UPI0036D325D3
MMKKETTNLTFIAKHAIVEVNYHNCYQIIISLKNTFSTTIGDEKQLNLKSLVINKGIKHSCSVLDAMVVVYYIDSDSLQGRLLKTILKDEPYITIEQFVAPQVAENIYAHDFNIDSVALVTDFANNTLAKIFPVPYIPQKIDSRIEKALTYIDENLHKLITLDELSSIIFLSSNRLRHLFIEEIGTSFSQYIIWKRINIIITEVINGRKSMAEAAQHYGFSDQSHFSKLFKRMFGVSAKMMLKPNPYIHFLNLDIENVIME